MTDNASDRRDTEQQVEPFIRVDQARERTEHMERLAQAPDVGDVTEDATDTDVNVLDDDDVDEADGLPGESEDIYARGVLIQPPG